MDKKDRKDKSLDIKLLSQSSFRSIKTRFNYPLTRRFNLPASQEYDAN